MSSAPLQAMDVRAGRFLAICAQLALLLVVFRLYTVEQPAFFVLSVITFGGFAVSYWLPMAWKEPFFVVLSIGGAFFLTEPVVVGAVLAITAVFFGLARMSAPYRLRAGVIAGLFLGLVFARQYPVPGTPPAFWPTIGALFMFRIMIFLYDLRNMKSGPSFTEFAAYFLMLPNFYFLFFPVVDYQTMRKSLFRRDLADVAQQGVGWIVRGTFHLLIYRAVLSIKPESTPVEVTSLRLLIENMVLTYLLYLRVSGTFHIIVGMLHLFGYDLPETHRKYLLARSITDLWRRINIYWKDFMVKVVYFPVFFRFRRAGPLRAQLIASLAVFIATWALHSYQFYWLTGSWLFALTDIVFWTILVALFLVNLGLELRVRDRGAKAAPSKVRTALQTAGMFTLMTFLWTLWSSPTLNAWLDLITYWKIG